MSDTTRRVTALPRKGPERRRHKRFLPRECDLSLERDVRGLMRIFGARKGNIARAVVDLSEGGARFVTGSRLVIGTRVNVTINVPLFNDTIKTEGEVCWCAEHNHKPGQFYVAVNFEKLDSVQARKISSIRDYISSPEFKQKEETRRRLRPELDTSSLEYDA